MPLICCFANFTDIFTRMNGSSCFDISFENKFEFSYQTFSKCQRDSLDLVSKILSLLSAIDSYIYLVKIYKTKS